MKLNQKLKKGKGNSHKRAASNVDLQQDTNKRPATTNEPTRNANGEISARQLASNGRPQGSASTSSLVGECFQSLCNISNQLTNLIRFHWLSRPQSTSQK